MYKQFLSSHFYQYSKKISSIAIFSSATLLAGCAGEDSNQNQADFDTQAMLVNIADAVIIPGYQSALSAAASISANTITSTTNTEDIVDDAPLPPSLRGLNPYCLALQNNPADEAETRAEAQRKWRALSTAWQQTQLYQFGPVTEVATFIQPYSETIRLSTCGVDQAVVLNQTDSSFNVTNELNNERGIAALEYLLFNDNLDHTCPLQVTVLTNWNSLPDATRKQQRCDYARVLATDIFNNIQQVANAWDIDQGNYRSIFINSQNINANLSLISDAVFYLDTDTKDIKVGQLVGLHDSCNSISCPEAAEAPYSQTSYANVSANLTSFNNIYFGGDGLGLDDYFTSLGFSSVNTNIANLIADAQSLINAQTSSLQSQAALVNDSPSRDTCGNDSANPTSDFTFAPCILNGKLRLITDILKTDFVTLINTSIPVSAQSDND